MEKTYASKWWPAIIALVLARLLIPAAGSSAPVEGVARTDDRTICVIVPHFKDEYWLSVGFGLLQEAAAAGAGLLMYESGGYHAIQRQIDLLDTCISRGADTVLIGAVSADDDGLLSAVRMASRKLPIVALVNDLHSPYLSGAVGVDWREMGRAVGEYLTTRHPAGSAGKRAGLITGSVVAGWSPLMESGLQEGLASSSVSIVTIRRSDTGLREQLREVENALTQDGKLDYIIGSAPAIEGAMGLAARSHGPFPALIATYISHSVRRGVQDGAVEAVVYDAPVEQGRLAVRVALAARPGVFNTETVGPPVRLVVTGSPDVNSLELSPPALVLEIE